MYALVLAHLHDVRWILTEDSSYTELGCLTVLMAGDSSKTLRCQEREPLYPSGSDGSWLAH
jgi:hypothetical protein